MVVGADQRASTSKTIAFVWTYTVAAALLSFIVARWLGHPGGYDKLMSSGLNAQYALLFGGPIGAAILAKGIVSAQIDNGSTSKPPADSANPAQLAQNDSGDTDLGDVQYLLFNTVALVFFYGEFLRAPQNGMPTLPDVLVGLTSVAAAGYVGKKALSGPPTISSVDPSAAMVGDKVAILTAGVAQSGDDLSLIDVAFGSAAPVHPDLLSATTTQGVLLRAPVPTNAAGVDALTVAVPNGKSATWPGFKVVPAIVEGKSTRQARVNQQAQIVTTGVSGLASIRDVGVSIGGRAAAVQRDANDPAENTLDVTVPDVPPGPTELTVTTPGGTSKPMAFTVEA